MIILTFSLSICRESWEQDQEGDHPRYYWVPPHLTPWVHEHMSTSLGCCSPTEGQSCQMLPARPGLAVVLRSVPAVWHRTPWPTAPLILAVPSEMSGKIIHPQRSWCHETHPFKGSELKARNAPYRGLGAFDSKALCCVLFTHTYMRRAS